MRNPYTPMNAKETVASGNFVGRREIWFNDLHDRLERKSGFDRHLLIQGRSGIGKTSLLRQIVHHAVNDMHMPSDCVHYIDLGEPGLTPLDAVMRIVEAIPVAASSQWRNGLSEAARRLAEAIIVETPVGVSFEIGKLLNDRRPETIATTFELADARLSDMRAKSKAIIILDQLGVIAEFAERARHGRSDEAWLHVIQRLVPLLEAGDRVEGDRRILFIMAVRMERTGTLLKVASDLVFSSAVDRIESLSALTEQEATQLVTQPAARKTVSFDDATVDLVLNRARSSGIKLRTEVTDLSPFALQLVCWSLWEWLRKEGKLDPDSMITMTVEELDTTVEDILGSRLAGFSQDERTILQLVAERGAITSKQLHQIAADAGIEKPEPVIADLRQHSLQVLRYIPPHDLYAISHDILREHFIRSIPPEQLQLLRVQRLLEDAPRRVKVRAHLTSTECDQLWFWHDNLAPSLEQLAALLESVWYSYGEKAWPQWATRYPSQYKAALMMMSRRTFPLCCVAIQALIDIGDTKDALPILKELVRERKDNDMRLKAAEVLVNVGETEYALPILKELVREEKDEDIRLEAIKILVSVEETEYALPILKKLVREEKDEYIRLEAIKVLVSVGETECALPILKELVGEEKDEDIRLKAIKVLGGIREIDAFVIIAELAYESESGSILDWAWSILTNDMDTDHLLPNLFSTAIDGPADTGYAAFVSLLDIFETNGKRESLIPLLEILVLNATSPEVREVAGGMLKD